MLMVQLAASIARALFSMPEYQKAKRISIYLSMPAAEVQTASIVRDALNNGKQVFIPYFYKLKAPQVGEPASTMDMLELDSLQDYEGLQLDKWGIPTPSEDSINLRSNCFGGLGRSEGEVKFKADADAGLDLIITPGLGFDRDLGRIGRGMGFYDNFFARCQSHSSLANGKAPWKGESIKTLVCLILQLIFGCFLSKVGLALNEQILPGEDRVPMEKTDKLLDALILGDGSVLRSE
jgi:5-formyltetrahydrofolate cyclo-ligase